MVFLEMSRDEAHGGGSWGFGRCVWAPTEKEHGGRWPFWDKVGTVRQGDIILHLRGVGSRAAFVGYSIASGDGFVTSSRPPDPRAWSFSNKFYRADLRDFVPFARPIRLIDVFQDRRVQLEEFFESNKADRATKKNIFFVKQSGRLQCLNGAYLSDLTDGLLEALFGEDHGFVVKEQPHFISVETGEQISAIKARIGQARFSAAVKRAFGYRCCFPGCQIDDERFLVGAHIARWSDNERLRGDLGNGLCLCLFHDKAFEIGLFTLDEKFRVYVSPKHAGLENKIVDMLKHFHGRAIRLDGVNPLEDALLEHWNRVDLTPIEEVS